MPLFRLTNGRAFGPYGRFGATDIDQTLGSQTGQARLGAVVWRCGDLLACASRSLQSDEPTGGEKNWEWRGLKALK